jgi:hypothetical protein
MTAKARTLPGKRPRLQARAIVALLAAPTIAQAADLCGVNEVTLRRWLRTADFAAALRAASAEMLDAAVARLQGGLLEATETFRRNLTCGKPSVEVAAARAVWDVAGVQQQLTALAAQIQQLERRIEIQKG